MYKLTYRKFEKRWADVFQIYPNAVQPESENASNYFSPKGGSWSQAFHAFHANTEETEDESSLFVSAVFCEEFSGKNRALYFVVTYKDVDRFRKGLVHEL